MTPLKRREKSLWVLPQIQKRARKDALLIVCKRATDAREIT
jgi:hypothetical protein